MRTLIGAASRALIPLAVLAVLATTAGAASAAPTRAPVRVGGGQSAVSAQAAAPVVVIAITIGTVTKCLDADRTGTGGPGNKVQVYECNLWSNQLWTLDGGSLDRIHNVWAAGIYQYAGYLTATGNYDRAPVQLSSYAGPIPNQRWYSGLDSNLLNRLAPPKCLDVDMSAGFVDGAKVQLMSCKPASDNANQRWEIIQVG